MRLYQRPNRFKSDLAVVCVVVLAGLLLSSALPDLSRQARAASRQAFFDDLDDESLQTAIQRSIAYLEKLPPERVLGETPQRFTARELLESLREFSRLPRRSECRACWIKEFVARFDLIPSSTDDEAQNVLFTGYYQPVIEASLAPTAEFAYPIYGKPADLVIGEQVTIAPSFSREKIVGRLDGENWTAYYSRREIEQGSLSGRGYEIAWVKDPIDLFFLHIQGSGLLQLPDGRRLQVGYAAANGRPYRSIGRLLIERGKIPRAEMSMQRLRLYLAEHPEERSEIFAYNESYVFFRMVPEGPLGSLEVPVTPERSIATDAALFPPGALGFIITEKPILDADGRLAGWKPFARFVLNQDTGGAIRGPQRVDLYFGTGADAGAAAGVMNRRGKLYFVALKKQP